MGVSTNPITDAARRSCWLTVLIVAGMLALGWISAASGDGIRLSGYEVESAILTAFLAAAFGVWASAEGGGGAGARVLVALAWSGVASGLTWLVTRKGLGGPGWVGLLLFGLAGGESFLRVGGVGIAARRSILFGVVLFLFGGLFAAGPFLDALEGSPARAWWMGVLLRTNPPALLAGTFLEVDYLRGDLAYRWFPLGDHYFSYPTAGQAYLPFGIGAGAAWIGAAVLEVLRRRRRDAPPIPPA